MASLVCEDPAASRLCTATCVAGGTISQLLRAGNQGMTRAAPKGDLLLVAAAMSAAAISAPHFSTTKRAQGQRRDLIKQTGDSHSYAQQAATLSTMAERVRSDAVFVGSTAPVLHNLRDSRRTAPQQQAPASSPASSGNWYFNLALQSSML